MFIKGLLDGVAPDWLPRLAVQCLAAPMGGVTTAVITNPLDIVRARIQVSLLCISSICAFAIFSSIFVVLRMSAIRFASFLKANGELFNAYTWRKSKQQNNWHEELINVQKAIFRLNNPNVCSAGRKHEIWSNSSRSLERREARNLYEGIISAVNPIRHVLLLHNLRL